MEPAIISKKGTITIPASIRKELKITPGMKFDLHVENGTILLIPYADLDDPKWKRGSIEESLRNIEEEHRREIINEARM